MRRFKLKRLVDQTGVSGTGYVAEGVRFTDGRIAMCWIGLVSSIGIYRSIGDVEYIHGHNGDTIIEWIDNAE